MRFLLQFKNFFALLLIVGGLLALPGTEREAGGDEGLLTDLPAPA